MWLTTTYSQYSHGRQELIEASCGNAFLECGTPPLESKNEETISNLPDLACSTVHFFLYTFRPSFLPSFLPSLNEYVLPLTFTGSLYILLLPSKNVLAGNKLNSLPVEMQFQAKMAHVQFRMQSTLTRRSLCGFSGRMLIPNMNRREP